LAQVIERDVAVLVLLIDQHRVALREGAALAVLPGETHGAALEQQRAYRQGLAGRPVDALAGLDRLAPVFQEPLDRAVDVEIRRRRRDLAADLVQRLDVDAGVAAPRVVRVARGLEAGPAPV